MYWGAIGAAGELVVAFAVVATLHDRGIPGEELTGSESAPIGRMMANASWYLAVMHFQYRVQELDEGDGEESRSLIAFYCGTPGFVKFSQSRSRAHGPEFLKYVDDEIQR